MKMQKVRKIVASVITQADKVPIAQRAKKDAEAAKCRT
jgi:hypothetical protein